RRAPRAGPDRSRRGTPRARRGRRAPASPARWRRPDRRRSPRGRGGCPPPPSRDPAGGRASSPPAPASDLPAVDDGVLRRLVQDELAQAGQRGPQPLPDPDDDVLRRWVLEELVQVVVIAAIERLRPDAAADL